MPANIKEMIAMGERLTDAYFAASQALTDYCAPYRGAMGLVSDECRDSEEYKKLKANFDTAHLNCRVFNAVALKDKGYVKAHRDRIMERRIKGAKNARG